MADLLYCGTDPVGPEDTKAMLAGEFRALWAPPMHRHAPVAAGDRIWLLWRSADRESQVLLGGGVVTVTPEGKIDWTNRTAPGIVAAARARGYVWTDQHGLPETRPRACRGWQSRRISSWSYCDRA